MAQNKPLMAKATAVWLVENTTLTFKQIADFCGLHELEVQGIADGDVAAGVRGLDPIAAKQLDPEEIKRGESDPNYRLKLKQTSAALGEQKRRGPRYTPLSKRQDRPAAILWLLKFHPELQDAQIRKLVGTTKATIEAIRNRTHWNIQNLQPVDPVALGLCKQSELDAEVQKAAQRKAAEGHVMSDDERRKLVLAEISLTRPSDLRRARALEGLEKFSLKPPSAGKAADQKTTQDEEGQSDPFADAERLFNLPKTGTEEETERETQSTGKKRRR